MFLGARGLAAVWQRARLVPRWWIACCVAVSLVAGGCHQQSDWILSYQLERSFALADVFAETSSVDLGTEDARGFLLEGWSWNEKNTAGETFVWSNGPTSTLVFHLYEVGDSYLHLRGLAFQAEDSPSQSVSISVSGTFLGEYDVPSQFTDLRVPVPAAALQIGWNDFDLDYKWIRSELPSQQEARWRRQQRDLAVAWDTIALTDGAELLAAPSVPSASSHLINQTLTIQEGTSVQYELELAPGSRLGIKDLQCHDCSSGTARIEVFLGTPDSPVLSSIGILSKAEKALLLVRPQPASGAPPPLTQVLTLRVLGGGELVLVQPRVERPVVQHAAAG